MFIVALFMTANLQKQPKYPQTEEWIKKVWYLYIGEYYSAVKTDKLIPFMATWMEM